MDTRQLIVDTAQKMFGDFCDKQQLDAAETGVLPDSLWQAVVENGFDQLGTAASGTTPADMFAFIQECGRYAVPLPMAETLIANYWFGGQELSSIGEVADGAVVDVPWGRACGSVVAVDAAAGTVSKISQPQVVSQSANMAGEPRDIVALPQAVDATTLTPEDDPYAVLALTRASLMAGCLQTILDLGIQFATERNQFGRSISKFQAIQHSLAVVAAEVAAAKRSVDAGVDAMGDPRFVPEVAAAKARVGEAAGVVAEQVHQIHGAMGFTHEHRLHHYTRRVWSWRDEWGGEFYWQARLGSHLAQLGADAVWGYIATRN